MSEKQFDIFDDAFRKAAEQDQPEYSEASWQKMEAKLDATGSPGKPAGRTWWIYDLLIISLMVFMAITLYINYQDVKPAATNTTKLPSQDSAINGKTGIKARPGPVTAGATKTGKKNLIAEPALTTTTQKRQPKTNTTEPDLNKAEPGISGSLTTNHHPSTYKTTKPENSPLRSPATISNQETNQEVANNQQPIPSISEKTGGKLEDWNHSNSYHPGINNVLNEDSTVPGKEGIIIPEAVNSTIPTGKNNADTGITQQATVLPPVVPKKNTQKNTDFFIHAGAATEWTYVPGRNAGPATIAYGGEIGYVIGKRWSVNAGMYVTKKNYTAGPRDYKARPGSYYYNLTIYHVDANCSVLELPVTVNYNMLRNKRHQLIASAGVSSLVMNKEAYQYDYQRLNGSRGYAAYTYKTGTFHPLAASVMAVKYQVKLNGQLYLTASPYIKIPLYGVGAGNIRIGSRGVMMGVQYQLPSLSK